jgi:hypothetical protein
MPPIRINAWAPESIVWESVHYRPVVGKRRAPVAIDLLALLRSLEQDVRGGWRLFAGKR